MLKFFAMQKLLTFFQQKNSEYCILNPLKQLTKWPLTSSLSYRRFEQLGPGLGVIKHFSCSTQLNMKFIRLIYLKLLSLLLNIAEHELISANKYENANYCWHFYIY